MATPKQVNYAIYLMHEAGYDAKWMGAKHKKLGATMRERQGSVRDWLEHMETYEISRVIDQLKEEIEGN